MSESKPLVLVADDETHILHVLSLKLAQAGYDVLTAEDGRAALELARKHEVDLLITDHQMPLLSGVELAHRLAADPATAGIPILLLTARGYNIRSKRLTGTRIVHVLTKPFSPSDLLRDLGRLLAQDATAAIAPTMADDIRPNAA